MESNSIRWSDPQQLDPRLPVGEGLPTFWQWSQRVHHYLVILAGKYLDRHPGRQKTRHIEVVDRGIARAVAAGVSLPRHRHPARGGTGTAPCRSRRQHRPGHLAAGMKGIARQNSTAARVNMSPCSASVASSIERGGAEAVSPSHHHRARARRPASWHRCRSRKVAMDAPTLFAISRTGTAEPGDRLGTGQVEHPILAKACPKTRIGLPRSLHMLEDRQDVPREGPPCGGGQCTALDRDIAHHIPIAHTDLRCSR